MSNWCEGTLKVRGKLENVQNFIENGFELIENGFELIKGHWEKGECASTTIPTSEWLTKNGDGDDTIEYFTSNVRANTVYVKDTKRAFADFHIHCIYTFFSDKDSCYTYIPVKQAWDYRSEDWLDIAKKYGIDIRLDGIESGGCFMRTIEIIHGEVTVDETKKFSSYADFVWNCPVPWMGG